MVVGMVTCCLATSSYAQECKTNIAIEDPATKQVCSTWDKVGDPEVGTHFTIDSLCTGCSDAPKVVLIEGGSSTPVAWVLYSEVISSGAAANLGEVLLNPTVASDKFELSIKNGAGAGAADVASIVLDDAGFTGYSNLGATTISGSVNGAITLVDDGGDPAVGGEVTGLVYIGFSSNPVGDVTGPITIPKIPGDLIIIGDYGHASANHAIDIGMIAGDSKLGIGGDILCNHSNTLAIDIDALGDTDTGKYGMFILEGSLTNPKATVTVTDMAVITDKRSEVSFEAYRGQGGI